MGSMKDEEEAVPPKSLRQRIKENPGVLRQSAKLISAESKCGRKLFNSWPKALQRTFFHDKEQNSGFDAFWRTLPFDERLEMADGLRAKAVESYKAGKFDDAADIYLQAAGLFCYVQGISLEDRLLTLVVERGNTAEMEQRIGEMRAACYSNYAQCCLQLQGEFSHARRACDMALELEPKQLKALYRRAQALEQIADNSSAYDALETLELAAKDLSAALKLSPSVVLLEASRRVSASRKRLLENQRAQFSGLLASHRVGGAEDREHNARLEKERYAAVQFEEQQLHDASRLRHVFLAEGREVEAREAESTIAYCQARLAEREGRGVNVLQPSDELVKEAQRFGVDLRDPAERREVDSLMWEVHSALHGVSEKSGKGLSMGASGSIRTAGALLVLLMASIGLLFFVRSAVPSEMSHAKA